MVEENLELQALREVWKARYQGALSEKAARMIEEWFKRYRAAQATTPIQSEPHRVTE